MVKIKTTNYTINKTQISKNTIAGNRPIVVKPETTKIVVNKKDSGCTGCSRSSRKSN